MSSVRGGIRSTLQQRPRFNLIGDRSTSIQSTWLLLEVCPQDCVLFFICLVWSHVMFQWSFQIHLDVILCQSVVRRHLAYRRVHKLRHEWQQAENVFQILFNMKDLVAVEQASATKIAMTWRRMRKTRLTRMVAAWRTMCVQEKKIY